MQGLSMHCARLSSDASALPGASFVLKVWSRLGQVLILNIISSLACQFAKLNACVTHPWCCRQHTGQRRHRQRQRWRFRVLQHCNILSFRRSKRCSLACVATTWTSLPREQIRGSGTELFRFQGPAGGRGPRVCILGGGFGGLYTAVRLESLLWPPGSKPQARLASSILRYCSSSLLLVSACPSGPRQ